MRAAFRNILVCSSVWVGLLVPQVGKAQDIGLLPADGLDFGNVELGTSASLCLRIWSSEPAPLYVEQLSFEAGSSPTFGFDGAFVNGTVPAPVPGDGDPSAVTLLDGVGYNPAFPYWGEFLDVWVGFTPDSLGLHTGSILIQSDAMSPRNYYHYSVQGTGVDSTTVPAPGAIGLVLAGVAICRVSRKRRRL